MIGCDPIVDDKIDIGPEPTADFSFEFIDANNIRFTNTTADNFFISNWDFGSAGTQSGSVVEVNFPTAGTYEANLTVFGKGGSGAATQTVTITQDDPNNCNGVIAFLTGCGQKVWKLNPAAGALWVGPNDGTTTTWWASAAGDVTGRDCDWNDEYIFGIDGSYEYDSKGDLWGESYSGFNPDGCYSTADLSADRTAWGSGTHTFEVIPAATGVNPKIRVIGDGAFLGIRKAANSGEVTTPQSEVTYDVLSMTSDGTKDLIELEVVFSGGIWRYILASE